MLHLVPSIDYFANQDIDTYHIQSEHTDEIEFQKTQFYQEWVKPQKLRDNLGITYVRRPKLNGTIAAPSPDSRPLYSVDDGRFFNRLSPHIRRSMMINEIVDRGKLALALYRSVLDTLSVAVFVVGIGRRVVFCNAAAEQLLEDGKLVAKSAGALAARRDGKNSSALHEAMDRAAQGHAGIGVYGIGVPLVDEDGNRAAAYVLPIGGNDLRGDLGWGYAAIFIAGRDEQQPMAIEILRTVFDLTPAEARISALIAKGDNPIAIAEALGLSVNTVRSHLARCYAKTGAIDQIALAATIKALMPPLAER
jgi:DNA-binding CsgD family transcriptional regulator